MARRMRIDFNAAAIRDLMQIDLTSERGAAIADACNGESSWGGYGVDDHSSEIRNRTVVWCAYATPERANRMIRLLGGGSAKMSYTTRSGKTIMATQAQIDNWTKGSG